MKMGAFAFVKTGQGNACNLPPSFGWQAQGLCLTHIHDQAQGRGQAGFGGQNADAARFNAPADPIRGAGPQHVVLSPEDGPVIGNQPCPE